MSTTPAPYVMVVEDDADIRAALAETLEDYGFLTLTARNGQDALDQLHAGQRPAVVLLDIMMPVMDGIEFRKRQQAEAQLASIPVIVITAADDVAAKQEALAAAGGFRKPVSVPELLSLIRRLIAAAPG